MSSLFGIGGGGNVGSAGGSFYSYSIDQSLRFNDDDSAYLSRTPLSAGNRKTWTWSGWVKRSSIDNTNAYMLFDASTADTNASLIEFGLSTEGDTALNVVDYQGGERIRLRTNMKFRDVSSFYHIVVAVDTTQASSTDRVKIYVNGEHQTSLAQTTYPSQNHDTLVNAASEHRIGKWHSSTRFFDGYMAEVNFIDGTALDPTSFGEEVNGVWRPVAYSGSYGTNGFYLSFADSAAIGDDLSGNTNDWTANNLAASDVVLDSPTNNFCTWNTLDKYAYNAPSEGSLRALTAGNNGTQNSTFAVSSGKWYWEARNITAGSGSMVRFIGIAKEDTRISLTPYTNSDCYLYYAGTGNIYNGSNLGSYGDTWGAIGDIIGVAFDADNGAIWFSKNGTWQNSATASEIAAGTTTNAAFTGLSGTFVMMVSKTGGTSSNDPHHANFGQDSTFAGDATTGSANASDDNGIGDFFYAPPSTFLALATSSLPEPVIGPNSTEQADDYFNTVLYTGDGSSSNAISVGWQPDWTWIKTRNGTASHALFDSVRGADNVLRTNGAEEENNSGISTADFGGLTSFDSNGFTVDDGTSTVFDATNGSGDTYVSWNWKAGGAAVSNTDGSITSQVSAAPDAGFSIVGFTSTGSTETVGHGLSQAPELYIRKSRSNAENWVNFFTVVDGTLDFMNFNTTNAASGSGASLPTSTVFSIGGGETNGETHVCYCFHSVPGYQAIGTYVGNGSTDGTFVYTGFQPSFLLIGKTAVGGGWNWQLRDAVRGQFNVDDNELRANTGDAESSSSAETIDFLSNGFKPRSANGATNENSYTYIYLAIGDSFKYANAR